MSLLISDSIFQTNVIGLSLLIFLLISLKIPKESGFFPINLTNELKGFAILGVLFAHIGYVLSLDHTFLFPLSVYGGIGVNIFLFLSGYGLAVSACQKPLSIFNFYKKRLIKLFLPLWVILIIFLILDFFVLQKVYPVKEIILAFLGFFPRADVSININSPLWYFTIIFFYYLIFPLFFNKNRLYFTSIGIFTLSYLILEYLRLPVHQDTLTIYKLHTLAFPLGVLFASFTQNTKSIMASILEKIKSTILVVKLPILAILFFLIYYTSINSGVGKGLFLEQEWGVVTTVLIILFFYLKNFEFKFLSIFGIFSYEIYLIHWPVLYRYEIFYSRFPASLATMLYILLFIILAFILQKIINLFLRARG